MIQAILNRAPKMTVFLLVSLVVLLAKPFILIRFGSLHAFKMGPLISRPSLYLLEKDSGVQNDNTIDIFHDGETSDGHVCNEFLLQMWKRVFYSRKRVLLSNSLGKTVYDMFYFLQSPYFFKDHIISTTMNGRDIFGLIESNDIYLKFTEKEKKQAICEMSVFGIQESDSFVCILNRSQSYLDHTFPDKDWDYHSFRNSPIKDYMLAADALTKHGHSVIRMGSVVGDVMNTDNSKIIDYAVNGHRSELLDIYLGFKCRFFVSSGTGLDAVPWFFKVPSVYVNFPHLELIISWNSKCLTIFQKYWLINESRYMKINEIIDSGVGLFTRSDQYDSAGIKLVLNTPEEILDVCLEMDSRLNGTWKEDREDDYLQEKFWKCFRRSKMNKTIRSRIGAKFLRANRDLL